MSESDGMPPVQRRTLRQQESYERVVRYLELQQHPISEILSPDSESLKQRLMFVPSHQQENRSSLRSTKNESGTSPSEKKTVRIVDEAAVMVQHNSTYPRPEYLQLETTEPRLVRARILTPEEVMKNVPLSQLEPQMKPQTLPSRIHVSASENRLMLDTSETKETTSSITEKNLGPDVLLNLSKEYEFQCSKSELQSIFTPNSQKKMLMRISSDGPNVKQGVKFSIGRDNNLGADNSERKLLEKTRLQSLEEWPMSSLDAEEELKKSVEKFGNEKKNITDETTQTDDARKSLLEERWKR